MEQEQRLTPLPKTVEIRRPSHEYVSAYGSSYGDEVVEGRRTVQQYLNVIYKRLPLIIALTTLVTVAAAFYMYRQPSTYQATTELLIEPRKPKVTSKESININFGQDINYYNTQLELLQNPDLMKKVVIALGLYRDKALFGGQDKGVLASIKSLFTPSNPEPTEQNALPVISENAQAPDTNNGVTLTPEEENLVNQYVGRLVRGLRIEQRERTNLVNVHVTNEKPALAAKVADKVAEVFRDDDAAREMQGEKQAIADLARSIEELQGTIAQQELELMSEMRSSGLPLQEKGQDLAATRLGAMSEAYIKAMEGRRQLESQYNAAVAANARGEGASIPQLTESKIYQDAVRLSTERKGKLQDDIRALDKQIQASETERAELLVKYTEEYDGVKKVDKRIEDLKNKKQTFEKEVNAVVENDKKTLNKDAVSGALVSLRSQLEAKRREEGQALAAYEREAAISNLQGQAQTKMTTLKRAIETNRSLLDTYTQRQKEQELSVTSSTPDNIKIAANAVVPTEPTGPARGRNIFVAFLFSLAAGIGLAFLMDYLDDSVKTSEDIGRHLGLPTLALIPHHGIAERRRLVASGSNTNGSPAPSAAMITLDERNSPMAEAYRHLRTSLLFSSAGKPPQTILVTSSQPSEGKTTTAIIPPSRSLRLMRMSLSSTAIFAVRACTAILNWKILRASQIISPASAILRAL